ncbi:MAG: hypothetical protein ACR2PF_13275, partial [Rhizobiaceae bacterium]
MLFYWASILVVVIKPGARPTTIFWVIAVSLFMNVVIVTTRAVVFSTPVIMRAYWKVRRWIEELFAFLFGAAAIVVAADQR